MIGICIGIIVVAFLPDLPAVWILISGTVFAVYLIVINRNFLYGNVLFRSIAWLLLGCCYAGLWGHWNLAHRMPLDSSPTDLVVSGEVLGLPKLSPGLVQKNGRENSQGRVQFLFQVEVIEVETAGVADLRKIRLNWYRAEHRVEPGQRWRFSVRLKPPVGLSNPGAFDLTGWLFQQGIDARGYVVSEPVPMRLTDSHWSLDRLRYAALIGLQEIGLSQRSVATLKALLLGDKSALGQLEWDLLRQSGTVHLVVISGLHISIVCLLGYASAAFLQRLALRWIPLAIDLRGPRVLLAIVAGVIYAALAGFSIPTQRALIMLCALFLPMLLSGKGVVFTLWKRWWLALTLVLMIQPLSVHQPGLWLSFTAVAVLFCATSAEVGQGRAGRVRQLIYSQWLIFIGLLPWLLFYTGSVALWAPLINLLAIPFLSFILLPGILILLVLGLFIPGFSVPVLDGLVELFWQGLVVVVGTGEGVVSADPDFSGVMLAICGVMLLALPRLLVFRWLGLFMFLPLLNVSQPALPDGQFKVWIFDVGQGLAVLIETRNRTVLYDTGAGFRSGGSVALYTVIPALQSFSVEAIDRLIVSHSDNDHSGGYANIEKRFEIRNLQSGSPSWRSRFAAKPCVSGQAWQYDNVRFSYVQPQHPAIENENNFSCVLLVESEHCSLLIPGDVESVIEAQILQQYPGLELDWLVAAHHGSRFSTDLTWLRQMRPAEVFFSAGLANQYGHPAAEVIARVEAIGARWKSTATAGAIILQQRGTGCVSESFRQQKKRYWTGS
ncbi:DNA internalization-related competence protein ComEC/Rec2 [Amphritea sp. HPY]|uniref:DNA internalization-related competence protein ComEC/Rec2 n=1 Tax=Amphritea sp. HPY TaxID=3421652 RepID=UPI003D7C4C0D